MENTAEEKNKVCIIDDDDNIREIYRTAFLESGYEVVEAANGEEGLRVIRESRPDIVLVDLMMPIMNGTEMLEELKKDADLARIPVIVLTNVDDREMAAKVGEMDVSFYLIKSFFDPKKVVATAEEVLQNKRSFSEGTDNS